MVEHLVYTEGVGGSSPSPPTRAHMGRGPTSQTNQVALRCARSPRRVSSPVGVEVAVAGGQRAEIAQLVEHAPEERGVASSNLALGTISGS